MGIPERVYRIFKYKLNELKEHFDQLDLEAQRDMETAQRRSPQQARTDARRELDDALSGPSLPTQPSPSPPAARRTPEEIAAGIRPQPSASPTVASNPTATGTPDPLAYHYRCLGVEAGCDFTAVQAAYNRLAARCDPGRFPAGSEEERQAQALRTRLEASFKILRDALDTTARRFDLLELDSPKLDSPKNETR